MEQQAEETWEQPEVQVQEEPQEEEQVETSRNTSRTLDVGVFFCKDLEKVSGEMDRKEPKERF